MSTSFLSDLLEIINAQQKIIFSLVYQLSSFYANSKAPKPTNIADLDYQKLTIDELPTVIEIQKLDYKQYLQEHLATTGKVLKPVKQRQGSLPIDPSV